jgi:hypothetical protein
LKRGQTYQDLGADYFEKIHAEDLKRYLVRKLQGQGFKLTLEPAAAKGQGRRTSGFSRESRRGRHECIRAPVAHRFQ